MRKCQKVGRGHTRNGKTVAPFQEGALEYKCANIELGVTLSQ